MFDRYKDKWNQVESNDFDVASTDVESVKPTPQHQEFDRLPLLTKQTFRHLLMIGRSRPIVEVEINQITLEEVQSNQEIHQTP